MPTSNINDFFNSLSMDIKRIFREYEKPIHNNIFFINKQVLRENSEYILFDKDRWTMCPHIFARDEYGDTYQYLYPVILTVNDISSIFNFKAQNFPERVIVKPLLSEIIEVLSNRVRS